MEEILETLETGAESADNIPDTPADAEQETKSAEEEFSELISGKYKKEFQKKIDGIIGARFREERREERRREEDNARQAVVKGLFDEAEQVKGFYPDFDIENELKSPLFKAILKNPEVDMRTAYEVVHHDEIFSSAMSAAARVAREKTVQEIISASARPSDTQSSAASTFTTDVRLLSKKEREEFARRARHGERVTFR